VLRLRPLYGEGFRVTEDFRVLADRRLDEARLLHQAGMWSGAYYLSGYSIECALKACVLKSIRPFHMPDKAMVNNIHTHDLQQLMNSAKLEDKRKSFAARKPEFAVNWAIVKDWNETSRYESWSQQEADDLLQAITQCGSGVLEWIKRHW
jgi:HEPN domain-containing protein